MDGRHMNMTFGGAVDAQVSGHETAARCRTNTRISLVFVKFMIFRGYDNVGVEAMRER